MSKEVGEGSVVVAEFRTDLVTFHLACLHVENHLQQEQKKRGKRNHRSGGKQDNFDRDQGKTRRRRSKYVRD